MVDNVELEAINASLCKDKEFKKDHALANTGNIKNPMVFFGSRWIMYTEKRESTGCTIYAFDRVSIRVYKIAVVGIEYVDILKHRAGKHGYKISFTSIGDEIFMIDGMYSKTEHRYVAETKKFAMLLATDTEACVATLNIVAFAHREHFMLNARKSGQSIISLLTALQ